MRVDELLLSVGEPKRRALCCGDERALLAGERTRLALRGGDGSGGGFVCRAVAVHIATGILCHSAATKASLAVGSLHDHQAAHLQRYVRKRSPAGITVLGASA